MIPFCRWKSNSPSKVEKSHLYSISELSIWLVANTFDPTVVQHMTTYFSILEKVKGSSLRLTKLDDEIYDHLMETFPDFDPAATINEDEMKSKAGKDKWRPFLMAYEKKVDDYNFGTMLRNSPKVEYEQDNTIFGRCPIFLWSERVIDY